MAKRRGQSAWNRKFGQISRECFRETSGGSMSTYGSCMSKKLKAESPHRRSTSPPHCPACL